MKYIHEEMLHSVIDRHSLHFLHVQELCHLASNNIQNKKHPDLQTWFSIVDSNFTTDEDTPIDQDTKFSSDDFYQVVKFYSSLENFKLDYPLNEIFNPIISDLKKLPGVEYIHLHSMKHFCIAEHVDGNLVLLINLSCPVIDDVKQIGLSIDTKVILPKKNEKIWLDTKLPHSAWNYTKLEWKFLAISIDRLYIKD